MEIEKKEEAGIQEEAEAQNKGENHGSLRDGENSKEEEEKRKREREENQEVQEIKQKEANEENKEKKGRVEEKEKGSDRKGEGEIRDKEEGVPGNGDNGAQGSNEKTMEAEVKKTQEEIRQERLLLLQKLRSENQEKTKKLSEYQRTDPAKLEKLRKFFPFLFF